MQKQRTPEDVARECGHSAVLQRLSDERFGAPGQFVSMLRISEHAVESSGSSSATTQLWVGDVGAMEVAWCADVDVTAVIYLRPSETGFPGLCAWLRKDKTSRKMNGAWKGPSPGSNSLISFVSFVVNEQENCWSQILKHLGEMLEFVKRVTRAEGVQKLIVCDENCKSIAPVVVIVLLLLLGQVRVKDSIEMLHTARPGIELGKDMMKGLQELQIQLDAKVLRRLNAQTRDSVVASIAF